MAKVSAGAGYKELKRVGNYVAPQVNAGADRLAANVRQQKELNAAEKARADKQIYDASEGVVVDIETLQAKATGFQNRDDLARDYAIVAVKRSEEYAEKAREAASRQDWTAMNNYKGKINRIKGDFKNTVNDEEILKKSMDKYRESWQNGEVDDEDWLDFGESLERFNYEIAFDENDNKVIRAIVLDDKNQPELDDEGNPKVIEKKWADVVSQRDRPYEVVQLEDKQGKKGLIGDMLATMGKRKYDENTGQFITTFQTWDDTAEKQFLAKVRGIQADDRSMYSLLKQASGGSIKKKDDFTEEDNKLVEDFLRYQVKGGYSTEGSTKVRTRTPEEIEKDSAADRNLRRELQKDSQEFSSAEAQKARDAALAQFQVKLAADVSADKVKGMGKNAKDKMTVARFYDVAQEVAKLGKDAKESDVQAVYDKSGLGFLLTGDFDWFGLADTQYGMGGDKSTGDIKVKDVLKNVKAMARASGIDIEETDIKEVMSEPEKYRAGAVESTSNDSDPLGLGI